MECLDLSVDLSGERSRLTRIVITAEDGATAANRRWRIEAVRVPWTAVSVAGLVLIGLGLRLFWVFYTDTVPLGGDPHWYYVVGINLARGFGFVAARNELWEVPGPGEPTAFWPPGYPFALAAVFKLFGVGLTSAQVLNAVLSALTIPLVYALGTRIFSRGVGLAAAGLFAVFPNVIAGAPLLFPEPLFTLLFVAALYVLVTFPPASHRWLPLIGFGALVGLAMLARGQGSVLIPVALVYWLVRFGWRQALSATTVAVLAAIAVIAPWTVRNAVELHAFIPVSTNSAAALRVGHNPDSIGTTKWTDDYINGFYMWESLYRPDWEVEGYREYNERAVRYAVSHPLHELQLSRWKVYHLYRSDSDVVPWLTTLGATPLEPRSLEDALPRALDYSYYILIFAAVVSAPLWLRRDANRLLLADIVLFWTLFHIVFLGEPRYHLPLYPAFMIGAAGGLWSALTASLGLLKRWRSQRTPRASESGHPAGPHGAETSA